MNPTNLERFRSGGFQDDDALVLPLSLRSLVKVSSSFSYFGQFSVHLDLKSFFFTFPAVNVSA